MGWLVIEFYIRHINLCRLFNAKSIFMQRFLFQAIQFNQTVLIQTIQFSVSMQFSSILPIDRALPGATIPGQSGPGSDDNEGLICIPQNSNISGTLPLDCLVSYPGH